jgi:hypothetical protein
MIRALAVMAAITWILGGVVFYGTVTHKVAPSPFFIEGWVVTAMLWAFAALSFSRKKR